MLYYNIIDSQYDMPGESRYSHWGSLNAVLGPQASRIWQLIITGSVDVDEDWVLSKSPISEGYNT